MKNKLGIILGFLIGTAGFLMLFKILILDRIPPEDELAPGMVVILAVVTGVCCAFMGRWVQSYFGRLRE